MPISRRAWLHQFLRCGICLSMVGASYRLTSLRANDSEELPFEAEFFSMGSALNLRWFGPPNMADTVLTTAKSISEHWVQVLSDYEPKSQVMVACKEADHGDWVSVSNELWNAILTCDAWNRLSNGAFDAALGALTRLRRQRKPSTPEQWDVARQLCGWDLLELDPNRRAFRSKRSGVRLDFGAIGKGMVVDRIAEGLMQLGIERFVVNASGNMRIGKPPPNKTGWPVSVDLPLLFDNVEELQSKSNPVLCRLRLAECGVATSGDRWQRFPDAPKSDTKDTSSHILVPSTKRGIAGHQSATIIAADATDADAAATATCVRASDDLPAWFRVLSQAKPELKVVVLKNDAVSPTISMVSNDDAFFEFR